MSEYALGSGETHRGRPPPPRVGGEPLIYLRFPIVGTIDTRIPWFSAFMHAVHSALADNGGFATNSEYAQILPIVPDCLELSAQSVESIQVTEALGSILTVWTLRSGRRL